MMQVDPAVAEHYRAVRAVLTELHRRYHRIALTAREPDRTKKLEALDSAIAVYTAPRVNWRFSSPTTSSPSSTPRSRTP